MEPASARPVDPLAAELLSAEAALARGATERTRAANALLVALARAARSFLLYDASNAAIHHFLEALHAAWEAYRTGFGALSLEIGPFDIRSGGEVIYHDPDRERSLAFRMYRDGVRRLDLSADVPPHELLKLLEILSIRYTGVRQSEDDMVVLLWKAGFVEIQVDAVEGIVAADAADARAARAARHVEAPPDFDLPTPALPDEVALEYRAVLPDAREALLAEDESSGLAAVAVRLGAELLDACARGELPWHAIAPQLAELRDFLLAESLLPRLLELAAAFMSARLPTPRDNLRRAQLLSSFAAPAALARVLRGIHPDARQAPPDLVRLLEVVPGDHLETLLQLVVTERLEVARRVSRTLIERWAVSHGAELAERARSGPPELACQLVRVFRYADPHRCVELAASLAERPEIDVQLAVVHALDALAVQTPPRVIQSLLRSASVEVRIATLEHVAAVGLRTVFPALLARVTRVAGAMEQREADAHARALAAGDAAHALEAFVEWTQPRGVFTVLSPAQIQLLIAALAGLARLPGEAAEARIRHAAETGGAAVQAAAQAAMRERRRAGVRA